GLLLYMTVQALNPAWQYVNTGDHWNMVALSTADYITWLPTGMRAPMTPTGPTYSWECMNAWRMILIYAAPWLTVCALWVGVTRRVTLLALLSVIALNGAALAVIGILEKVAGNGKILWFISAGRATGYFISTFAYKNHAGAFFNLIIAAAGALALWHFTRGDRRSGRANPAPLFALCAALGGMIILLSNSRAATILLILFVVAVLVGGGIWLARSDSAATSRAVIGLLAAVFLLFVGGGVMALNYDEQVIAGLERLTTTDRAMSVDGRRIAAHATWEMAQDRLITGWGAGSFRYYFPVNERNYLIWYETNNRWEYAHNDYLQILAELGLIGLLTAAAGTAYWLFKLFRHGAHLRPHSLVLLGGLLILMAHAWVDFPLYCPAILLTWCVLWVLAARWAEFEDNRVRD
ncbi:MAG: O-antigen ligase family protein, partial [Verrucomicrobiota bacterium]